MCSFYITLNYFFHLMAHHVEIHKLLIFISFFLLVFASVNPSVTLGPS